MANTVDKVIKVALAEEGYQEKSKAAYLANPAVLESKDDGAGYDNYTKYGRDMHKIYPSVMDFPASYCDCFVDWCFMQAYGITTAKSLLGGNFDDYTVASSDMYKRKGAWFTSNPQLGDQIFFKNSQRICHTGLVIGVDKNRVYTIEGNTSPASGVIRNGGGVYRKSYELNHPRIAGYGRPNYDTDNSNNPSPTDIASGVPSLRRGSLGDEVKKLQANLNSVMGENLEVDGIFGGGTQRVLQSFQTKYGLEVDGIYGRGSEGKMRELLYK